MDTLGCGTLVKLGCGTLVSSFFMTTSALGIYSVPVDDCEVIVILYTRASVSMRD